MEDATGTLGAGSIETGTYPVVFRRSVATELLQAFVSLFSGESAKKNLTLLKGKEGTKVFGDNITIYDDPFVENAIVKIPCDDEGVPCHTKTLVENGVFKMFLHNLATADYFQTASTGNGFKSSVASSVRVGPTNLICNWPIYFEFANHNSAFVTESTVCMPGQSDFGRSMFGHRLLCQDKIERRLLFVISTSSNITK